VSDPSRAVLSLAGLQSLIDALRLGGYRVVGPTVRDKAIVYDDIASTDDLPRGWTDEQEGGTYRLIRRGDDAAFGYAVGPHSWKRFLLPPIEMLWRSERDGEDIRIRAEPLPAESLAFIGVRACELQAIAVQDRVLMGDSYADPRYRARRQSAFIVALNCAKAGGTCFCVSMKTGPRVGGDFDLALTEIANGREFLVEAGSDRGRALLPKLPQRAATDADIEAAAAVVARTASAMGREMRSDDLRELLQRNLDHPRWDDVAGRCLSCGNCTLVCPTCFCTSTEDGSDLSGATTSRARRWDSCFTLDFSYIHGGSVRPSTRSRYRQWMTHKLSTWWDQFGTSGCVGCGRCITWCPVAIDITEEVRAIRDSEAKEAGADGGT
jgi:sulfhydrogenase subunit beta (sulfur reductase)